MWTRAQLKEKAKFATKVNYWKAVIVSLIISLVVSGGAMFGGFNTSSFTQSKSNYQEMDHTIGSFTDEQMIIFAIAFFVTFTIVLVVALAIGLVVDAFLLLPLSVGCSRFFLKNLNEPAKTKEVMYAFDSKHYKNIAKIMFLREIFIMLWGLLFIIPGIVKSYEYRMIPYLLAENPEMTKQQAFQLSRQMMNGNKWKAFVLDLSFLGWRILSLITMGILGIFYVNPYYNQTCAAFYEVIKCGNVLPIYGQPLYK